MSQYDLKRQVAQAALKYAQEGVIGVGSGSTVNFFIDCLKEIRGKIDGAVAASEASAERLVGALRRAVAALGTEGEPPRHPFTPPPPWGPLELSPRRAFLGPQETVAFPEAVGRLAAESLAAYPPGIPNVLPGERLTQETVDYVGAVVEHGGWVRGAVDRSLRTVRVVVE